MGTIPVFCLSQARGRRPRLRTLISIEFFNKAVKDKFVFSVKAESFGVYLNLAWNDTAAY